MDPNECWKRINQILSDGVDPFEAAKYIAALDGWLRHGGFEPIGFDKELFDCMVSWIGTGCKQAAEIRAIQ